MNFYTEVGGGFGDILRVYLSGEVGYPWQQPFWGKLEGWLRSEGHSFKLTVASHNPDAASFFDYVPWIDGCIKVPWDHHLSEEVMSFMDGYEHKSFDEINNLTAELKWHQPKVYLSESEEKLVDEYSKMRYVFLYPFGGYGPRMPVSLYLPLIERLVRSGLKVVVCGATYTRYTGGSDDKKIVEELDCDLPEGAINAIGCGVRLATALALNAEAYIGSLGCYMHAALAANIPSYILTCYEVWDDDKICGRNIQYNGALSLLMRNIGSDRYSTSLFVILNDMPKTLNEVWALVLGGVSARVCSGLYRVGDEYRNPVSF